MSLLLLVVALVVAGAGAGISRRWRVAGQAMIGLGILGLLGVVAWQVRQNVFPPPPRTSSRYEMAVSYGLASCLLADAAGQSGKVLLLFPSRRDLDENQEASYEDGFVRSLRHGHTNLELKAVRLDGVNNDLAAFKQALAGTPEALAVVSYAGIPDGFDTLFSAGQSADPPFYVFDGKGTTRWLGALKAGRIKAVVVPRPEVPVQPAAPVTGMPDAVFDRFFLLVTSANADAVANQETTRPAAPKP